ncbi:MAG: enoyl-CoA hydratase [Rhodococcus sp. (in: high G+C Gram-positive bacteria)]
MAIGTRRSGAVLTVELQRPERRNAVNAQVCREIRHAVERAAADGDVRAIVLTGEGSSFCAGADLTADLRSTSEFADELTATNSMLETVPIPVIAAVNGPAVGAGTQLAIAADLRVVSPDGFFAIPSAKLAIAVDNWTVNRLVLLAGHGPARTVLLGAERIGAEQAYTCGLANKIGDLDAALAWADDIAHLAPLSLQHLKLVFNDDGTRQRPTDAQTGAFAAAWASSDAAEAMLAHSEKRRPVFRGA